MGHQPVIQTNKDKAREFEIKEAKDDMQQGTKISLCQLCIVCWREMKTTSDHLNLQRGRTQAREWGSKSYVSNPQKQSKRKFTSLNHSPHPSSQTTVLLPPSPGCWDLVLQAGSSVYCQCQQVTTNRGFEVTPRLQLWVSCLQDPGDGGCQTGQAGVKRWIHKGEMVIWRVG